MKAPRRAFFVLPDNLTPDGKQFAILMAVENEKGFYTTPLSVPLDADVAKGIVVMLSQDIGNCRNPEEWLEVLKSTMPEDLKATLEAFITDGPDAEECRKHVDTQVEMLRILSNADIVPPHAD